MAIALYVERHGLPDALLGGNDQMGCAALTWAQDRNLAVPGDVRVTGFNDFVLDRKSTRLNSSHMSISYAVFCLKKKKKLHTITRVHGTVNSFGQHVFTCERHYVPELLADILELCVSCRQFEQQSQYVTHPSFQI